MSTALQLESLTNRATFELLATSVLRKAVPLYAGIIQTGINANGETIVAPIDGLHRVPHSDPAHYVIVQHTTTDRKGLRGKWLSNEDADLRKALVEVDEVRQTQSDAVFTVVLSTNQRVEKKLALDVYNRAAAAQVEVDIWEQSRIADFLDTTADGHWLRRLYLGTEAERLSADLLHELGRRSLELYRREVLLLDDVSLVHRGLVENTLASADLSGQSLCLLVGSSGYGKTVVAMQGLSQRRLHRIWESPEESEMIRTNAFCLWLQTTGCRDVGLLRTIEPEAPFYRYALQHRVRIGDRSSAPELLALIRTNDLRGWWWVLAHRVWSDELRLFASRTLGGLKGNIPTDFSGGRGDLLLNLAQLLAKIPPEDGEMLLQGHWGHLKFSQWMVHVAFRIGTPACVELARESLSLCPSDVDVFELAFSTIWDLSNPANPIALQHLRNLEPYPGRMTRDEVLFLAWETERAVGWDEKIAEWIRTHLVPRLPRDDQVRVQVADQMLVNHLDHDFEKTRFEPYLRFIFDDRHGGPRVSPERQLQLLDEWLSKHRTDRGLAVAGECLKHIGARKDLRLMDRYPIHGDVVRQEKIKADTSFSIRKRTLS